MIVENYAKRCEECCGKGYISYKLCIKCGGNGQYLTDSQTQGMDKFWSGFVSRFRERWAKP